MKENKKLKRYCIDMNEFISINNKVKKILGYQKTPPCSKRGGVFCKSLFEGNVQEKQIYSTYRESCCKGLRRLCRR